MDETGIRFPGYLLDPRAQEFRPRSNNNSSSSSSPENQIPCVFHPQIYYPYPPPPPLPPTAGFPLLPGFYDGTAAMAAAAAAAYYNNQIPSSSSSTMAYVIPSSGVPPAQGPSSPLPPLTTAATRVLLLSSVPGEVSEETVRRDMEVFGQVRAVQMERLIQDGIVTVHYYDLRSAETAMMEIQEQHMQQQIRSRQHYHNNYSLLIMHKNWGGGGGGGGGGEIPPEFWGGAPPPPPPATISGRGLIAGRAVWAQFTVPMTAFMGPAGRNQGTIVVFNMDSGVSSSDNFKQIFEAFGPVKEIRDTPSKRNQRFVEFYDIRDAARALTEMDGKQIHGKRVIIEFSRPGGHRWMEKKLMSNSTTPPVPVPVQAKKKSSSSSSTSSNLCRGNWNSNNNWRSLAAAAASINKDKDNGGVAELMTDHESIESVAQSSDHQQQVGVISSKKKKKNKKKKKKNSSISIGQKSNINGDIYNYPSATILAAAGQNKQQQQQQQQEAARSSVGAGNSSSIRSSSSSSSSWNNIKKAGSSSSGKQKNKQQQGSMGSLGSQFLIDERAIQESNCIKDTRTTVMIKNIPNKYSQKLLLNMLDSHCIHCNEQISDCEDQPLSSYDFLYLPIDFNNKCNVGYGFVNMTSPQGAWRLYKAFHLQPWEVFNSRKICQVTYARLQGLEALKEHFKNSKFACETEEYLPVVFSPPRDGKQQLTQPVPMGTSGGAHGLSAGAGCCLTKNMTTKQQQQQQLLHLMIITRNHDNPIPTSPTHNNIDDDEDDDDDDGSCINGGDDGGDDDDEDDDKFGSFEIMSHDLNLWDRYTL